MLPTDGLVFRLSISSWAQTVIIVGVGAVLTLVRFPEAFLILRAQNAGLALTN
jgi:hypothetical protein